MSDARGSQEPFDLHACLEDALDRGAEAALRQGVTLDGVIAPELPATMVGDPRLFQGAVETLLAEATASAAHGVVALVARPEDGPAGPRLIISVLGGAAQPSAAAEAQAAALGGTLTPVVATGRSPAVTLALPLASEPGLPPPLRALAGRRLLLIGGDPAEVGGLAEAAGRWGMAVTSLTTGLKALEWADQEGVYDVLLLRRRLPDLDGATLARTMARFTSLRGRPMVLIDDGAAPVDGGARSAFAAILPPRPGRLAVGAALARAVAGPLPGAAAPLRVLIAEDNAVSRELLLRLVARLGHSADGVADGVRAVEAARRQAYDVILMDLEMPLLNGLGAAAQIRALGRPQAPLIVAVTGHARPGDRERYLAAGMDGYLSKPVQLEDLRLALTQVSAAGPGGAGALAPPLRPEPPASDLDWELLTDLLAALGGGDRASAELVRGLLGGDLSRQVEELADLMATGDAEQIRHVAHRLGGGARQVGAMALAVACDAIEDNVRGADEGARAVMIGAAREAHRRAVAAFEARYPPAG